MNVVGYDRFRYGIYKKDEMGDVEKPSRTAALNLAKNHARVIKKVGEKEIDGFKVEIYTTDSIKDGKEKGGEKFVAIENHQGGHSGFEVTSSHLHVRVVEKVISVTDAINWEKEPRFVTLNKVCIQDNQNIAGVVVSRNKSQPGCAAHYLYLDDNKR